MPCKHSSAALAKFKAPASSTKVYKDECTQCFESALSADGLLVCLECFNGGCAQHALSHSRLSGHSLALQIRKTIKIQPSAQVQQMDTISTDRPRKVQIVEEKESDLFDTQLTLHCLECRLDLPSSQDSQHIIDKIVNATSAKQKSDIKAWEEEILPCEHTLCLEQQPSIMDPAQFVSSGALKHCTDCDQKENLWLCLVCGNVGCGRRQFDGSGGNNHGIDHFTKTGHQVACKLGTITADGSADIYCYKCDDMKLDPELILHLSTFGMSVAQQEKTEKSMAELQLEQNLKWEFNMASDDGKLLEPVFGAQLTGLKNIGNSCYLASVLQSVVTLPLFSKFADTHHWNVCKNIHPVKCAQCQLLKLTEGLNSGRFSKPSLRKNEAFQDGVPPTMFKEFACSSHEEFKTPRQQDSYEFIQYLLSFMDKYDTAKPSKSFEMSLSHRLECNECHHVGYSKEDSSGITIPLDIDISAEALKENSETSTLVSQCISKYSADEVIDDFKCPVCQKIVKATRQSRFTRFPKYLIMQMNRFILENWIPKKLNTKIKVDIESIDFSPFQSSGKPAPGETLFPENNSPQNQEPDYGVKDSDVQQLMSMGFSKNRSIRSLQKTGNAGAEVAMEWLFSQMDDASLDDPLPAPSAPKASSIPMELIENLQSMGFTAPQARKALRLSSNNIEAAVEWLFSNSDDPGEQYSTSAASTAVSAPAEPGSSPQYNLHAVIAHKGTSTACGHYVAYVKHSKLGWVLFNDEKVVKVPAKLLFEVEGADLGYIFIWRNKDV